MRRKLDGMVDDGLRDDEVKELLTRQSKRRRNCRRLRAQCRAVWCRHTDLAAGRWREAANAVGSVNFDTHREITYGSDDDEEEVEDDR